MVNDDVAVELKVLEGGCMHLFKLSLNSFPPLTIIQFLVIVCIDRLSFDLFVIVVFIDFWKSIIKI